MQDNPYRITKPNYVNETNSSAFIYKMLSLTNYNELKWAKELNRYSAILSSSKISIFVTPKENRISILTSDFKDKQINHLIFSEDDFNRLIESIERSMKQNDPIIIWLEDFIDDLPIKN